MNMNIMSNSGRFSRLALPVFVTVLLAASPWAQRGISYRPGEHVGETEIVITETGDALFYQFCSIKVLWKGTGPDGKPTEGGLPKAQPTDPTKPPIVTDGSQTYVDSEPATNPGGEYGGVTGGNGATSYIVDAPNLMAPNHLAGQIKAANPGVTITEVTKIMTFTTYVIRLPNGGITRYQWSHTETVKIDPKNPPAEPHHPNGAYGGPGVGNTPTETKPTQPDPHHALALALFVIGITSGAPNGGAW
ncbi:MAG: hypothetical protein ABL998_04660 [Planctomycetota bacterium]